MNCFNIVEAYLKANGYEGLCLSEHECGCSLADLAPCGEGPFPECQPAMARELAPDDPYEEYGLEPGDMFYYVDQEKDNQVNSK